MRATSDIRGYLVCNTSHIGNQTYCHIITFDEIARAVHAIVRNPESRDFEVAQLYTFSLLEESHMPRLHVRRVKTQGTQRPVYRRRGIHIQSKLSAHLCHMLHMVGMVVSQ